MGGRRWSSGVVVLALALGAAGCGDDEQSGSGAAPSTTNEPERTETVTVAPPTTEPDERERTERTGTGSPEGAPGGAGDEEPARSQARFRGRAGRISPRLVRVPPFIAVRIELRSADGATYGLRFGRHRVEVGGDISTASTTLAGLRPGKSIVGRQIGGGRVRVEASAEPGP